MKKLQFQTKKKRQIVSITQEINDLLGSANKENGLCNVFIAHTTAALSTADLDPGTDLDMLDAFEALIPPNQSEARFGAARRIQYRHPHDPEHVPDHILSTLIGTSLTIPFEKKKLLLGAWQEVVLIELDGPRERTVIVSIL